MKNFLAIAAIQISLLFTLQIFGQGLLKIENPLRVVSYNIRFDNPDDRDNVWANRKERVANVLRFHKTDIFCLQEALINQIHDLETEFPGFEYYGLGRDDGKEGGEFCPVFYNKSRFKIIDKGTFWLSETPDVPGSKGWYADLPRIATWVKFIDLSDGSEFFVFNTHLDHISQNARDNGTALIIEKINKMVGDLPVVLTGDFNDRPKTKPYNNILDGGSHVLMFDARSYAKYPHHGPTFTFVGWDFIGVPGKIIDYIFVNSKVSVTYHAILTDNWDGVYPSDHLPVLIEMKFK